MSHSALLGLLSDPTSVEQLQLEMVARVSSFVDRYSRSYDLLRDEWPFANQPDPVALADAYGTFVCRVAGIMASPVIVILLWWSVRYLFWAGR